MISFAIVAMMTTITGCHAQKACATPCAAPVAVVCAPAAAACAPAPKHHGIKLAGLLHHNKAAAACAPVACAPAPKHHGIKLAGLFHHKKAAVACDSAPVAYAAAPVAVASPQSSAQH